MKTRTAAKAATGRRHHPKQSNRRELPRLVIDMDGGIITSVRADVALTVEVIDFEREAGEPEQQCEGCAFAKDPHYHRGGYLADQLRLFPVKPSTAREKTARGARESLQDQQPQTHSHSKENGKTSPEALR